MTIVRILLAALVASGVLLAVRWTTETRRLAARGRLAAPTPPGLVIGFVTNFFDTLGIGSFATTTSIPCARATSSESPTDATSGSVKVTQGIAEVSKRTGAR